MGDYIASLDLQSSDNLAVQHPEHAPIAALRDVLHLGVDRLLDHILQQLVHVLLRHLSSEIQQLLDVVRLHHGPDPFNGVEVARLYKQFNQKIGTIRSAAPTDAVGRVPR